VGKTELALHTAECLAAEFADGVAVAELGTLPAQRTDNLRAVSRALLACAGVPPDPGQPGQPGQPGPSLSDHAPFTLPSVPRCGPVTPRTTEGTQMLTDDLIATFSRANWITSEEPTPP